MPHELCMRGFATPSCNEMGEDVRNLLVDYLRLLSAIRQTVSTEAPVVRTALAWTAKVFQQ
jgi:hypothetical protein